MSEEPTLYKILGVGENATTEEIKRAFREIAKEHHPDLNEGAEDTDYKNANDAYNTLRDPIKRAKYDRKLQEQRTREEDDDIPVPPNPPSPPQPPAQPPTPNPAAPVWTASDAFAAITTLLWGRLRPYAIGAGIGLCLVGVGVLIFIGPDTFRSLSSAGPDVAPAGPTPSQNPNTPVAIPHPEPPRQPPIRARLEPIAYSYAEHSWANHDPLYSSGYPNVSGLGFHNRLGWGAAMSWTGSDRIMQSQISLGIDNLRLPGEVESTLARQMGQVNWWSDVGVGYHVELQGAFFEDHSMAKDFLIFRTFLGDKPPGHIEKGFSIIPRNSGGIPTISMAGEWHGNYEWNGERVPFVMRLTQEANEFSGSMMEYQGDARRRSSIRGEIEVLIVTFLKRYADGSGAVAYVSTAASSSRAHGSWQSMLQQGSWSAERTGDFEGSVDDFPSVAPQDTAPNNGAMNTSRKVDDESWRLRRSALQDPQPQ